MLFFPAFNSYLMDDVNGVFHSFLILYFFKEKNYVLMSSSVRTEKKVCFHLVEKVVVIHRGE